VRPLQVAGAHLQEAGQALRKGVCDDAAAACRVTLCDARAWHAAARQARLAMPHALAPHASSSPLTHVTHITHIEHVTHVARITRVSLAAARSTLS
jgi:hypothetical protein